jgi:hypothetical protein
MLQTILKITKEREFFLSSSNPSMCAHHIHFQTKSFTSTNPITHNPTTKKIFKHNLRFLSLIRTIRNSFSLKYH